MLEDRQTWDVERMQISLDYKIKACLKTKQQNKSKGEDSQPPHNIIIITTATTITISLAVKLCFQAVSVTRYFLHGYHIKTSQKSLLSELL